MWNGAVFRVDVLEHPFSKRKIMFVLSTISVARTNEPIKTTEPKPRLISIKKVYIFRFGWRRLHSNICPFIKHRAIRNFQNNGKLAHRPFGSAIFICECTEIMHWAHYKWIYNGPKEKKKKNISKMLTDERSEMKKLWCIVYVYRVPNSPHSPEMFLWFWHNLATVCMGLWMHLWSTADVFIIYAKRFHETG